MPMSPQFEERLFPALPMIADRFGTPFLIYDAEGIRETCRRVNRAFAGVPGFRNYYAVKALPNPAILRILREEGFGFDCSSTIELDLSTSVGARGEDMMFTSNDTTDEEFDAAIRDGAIINLDDVSFIDKLPDPFPELICFRYNPGAKREGNNIIGKPEKAKYGITDSQVIEAYRRARDRGAMRFGIHTMICSNQRDYRYMVETVTMLLAQVERLDSELGIRCEFMNIGGGLGIAYRPEDSDCDVEGLGAETERLIEEFRGRHGWAPNVLMESGRFITGQHGVLVNRAINRKEIYQTYVGVEVAMPALMRPAIYDAYHHITVLDPLGLPCDGRPKEHVHVVGPICENCDRLTDEAGRLLPRIFDGDFIVTHTAGAHALAMGFNYNGRLRPQELLLWPDRVERIRRAETNDDLWRTLEGFDKNTIDLRQAALA